MIMTAVMTMMMSRVHVINIMVRRCDDHKDDDNDDFGGGENYYDGDDDNDDDADDNDNGNDKDHDEELLKETFSQKLKIFIACPRGIDFFLIMKMFRKTIFPKPYLAKTWIFKHVCWSVKKQTTLFLYL